MPLQVGVLFAQGVLPSLVLARDRAFGLKSPRELQQSKRCRLCCEHQIQLNGLLTQETARIATSVYLAGKRGGLIAAR